MVSFFLILLIIFDFLHGVGSSATSSTSSSSAEDAGSAVPLLPSELSALVDLEQKLENANPFNHYTLEEKIKLADLLPGPFLKRVDIFKDNMEKRLQVVNRTLRLSLTLSSILKTIDIHAPECQSIDRYFSFIEFIACKHCFLANSDFIKVQQFRNWWFGACKDLYGSFDKVYEVMIFANNSRTKSISACGKFKKLIRKKHQTIVSPKLIRAAAFKASKKCLYIKKLLTFLTTKEIL